MDELRFVRREELALIVANDADEEFRLVVDDAVLSELRHLSRRERDGARIRPREIQALIRSGKTRSQVAQATGLDEADIERYEEPVLAERRYILERAQAVPVRVDAHVDGDRGFGEVIAERLVSLDSEAAEWNSWKEEEVGWLIALEFISHDTAHRAVWSFDHRKNGLSPMNPDAVNLSKQGEVGDRLIPKLRAVDDGDRRGRFDSGAFDPSQLSTEETAPQPQISDAPPQQSDDRQAPEVAAEPRDRGPLDPDAEYERRREIDQRAVKTDSADDTDFSQTADLLDALRRRRGERERNMDAQSLQRSAENLAETPPAPSDDPRSRFAPPAEAVETAPTPDPAPNAPSPAAPTSAAGRSRSIWAAGGVSREAPPAQAPRTEAPEAAAPPVDDAAKPAPSSGKKLESARKGRASIPSWDDILFGTRSDEDPA